VLSAKCKPEKGDLLYTKGGTTGIARVNNYDLEFNVWVHVAVLKLANSVRPFFLQHALNSPKCYAQAQKLTHGVGNQDLGLTRMVNILVPFCSPPEQEQVERVVDQMSSNIEQLAHSLDDALRRISVLRKSILEKAFSGQLVPQDPNDEPASVLLDRIKAEKEATGNNTRKIKKLKAQGAPV
jgi:type I restriction enzyme S subunit